MQCLKVLTMSGWNPPPGNRKMHGDLMYLYIVTVEERHVSVTASTRGFYLNQLVNDSILLLQSLVRTVNTSIKKKKHGRYFTFKQKLMHNYEYFRFRILNLDPF